MLAGFLAATNPARVAIAARAERPRPGAVALAGLLGAGLVVVAALLGDELLDALDVSPESFRIAAGLVAGATGARWIGWPRFDGPFAAVLVTPELACLAVSFGADEPIGTVLAAAAISVPLLAVAALSHPGKPSAPERSDEPAVVAARFLAALQVVVAVGLVVSGVCEV